MGLVKLYRVTGEENYLDLAKFLLDVRGPDGDEGRRTRIQPVARKVVDQTEAVGHAVRATYMYSGMADVAALTGDRDTQRHRPHLGQRRRAKLYITGGIGATGRGEAFGGPYELPNMTAYNETCAAIGNDYWNHRLFLLHGDAKYIDVMERTLYNGLISGVSLDGKSFFYPNPLESNGQHQRSPWFGVACCPGNITRFLASVPGYVYAKQGQRHLREPLRGGPRRHRARRRDAWRSRRTTRYPWDGAVQLHGSIGPDHVAGLHDEAAHSRAGRATSPCRATSIASSIASTPPVAIDGQRRAASRDAREGLRRASRGSGGRATPSS